MEIFFFCLTLLDNLYIFALKIKYHKEPIFQLETS